MGRRKTHYPFLEDHLKAIGKEFNLTYHRYNEYHMRLFDEFTCLDVWTTAKYYVKDTNYYLMAPDVPITERAGETGWIPTKKKELAKFVHKLFIPLDFF